MPASLNNPIQVLVTIDADATSATGTPVTATIPRACKLVQLWATNATDGEALEVVVDNDGDVVVIFGSGGTSVGSTAASPLITDEDFDAGSVLTVTTGTDTMRGTVLAVFHPVPAQALD
jgi:hypothetical protein